MTVARAVPEDRLAGALRRFERTPGAQPKATPASYPLALPSHMGLDGESFLIVDDEPTESRFLKLYRPGWTNFAVSEAIHAARQAGELGVAPAVLDADEALGAALFATPGPDWRMAGALDFDKSDCVSAAMEQLRLWHGSARLGHPAPSPLALADELETAPGVGLPDLVENWGTLRAWATRIADALAVIGHDPAPLHREVYISNFLIGPAGGALMVDFDYAADGDVHADLAAFALEVCEVETDYPGLVERYAGNASPDLVARTMLHAILEDFRWGCIALHFHRDAARRGIADFKFYADLRFWRCLGHIQSWNPSLMLALLR